MIFYEQLQLVSYYLLLVQVTVEHTYIKRFKIAYYNLLFFIKKKKKKKKRKILLCFGSSTK